ncbi:MAG TPA: hypothetical protein VMH04_02545 [Candidatus Solibacter sp.]|nr:hypothetical protein [Candidatus Solibacter sp.]
MADSDDDLDRVIREERSRGRRPIDTDAAKAQQQRRESVLQILRRGTREDLKTLLKTWGYSQEEIEKIVSEYDAALE